MKRNIVILLVIAVVGAGLVSWMQAFTDKEGLGGRQVPAWKYKAMVTSEQERVVYYAVRAWRNDYAERPFSQAQLIYCLKMTKDEFFKEYKQKTEVVLIRLAEQGIREGYFFKDLGVCVSFEDDGRILWVDCRDGFELNGARAGMSLGKIKTILGEAPVRTEELAGGRKVYVLEYTFADYVAQFISYDRDGTDDGTSFLRVLPRRDIGARLKQALKMLIGYAKSEEYHGAQGMQADNPVKGDWWMSEYLESPLTTEELAGLVSMTKGEILKKYGYDYEVARTGTEGLLQGYFYRRLGVCIMFDADGRVGYVDCCKGVGINGATVGTRMDEVRARVGEVPVAVGKWEAGFTTHTLRYPIGEGVVQFISFRPEKNDKVSRVSVVPKRE